MLGGPPHALYDSGNGLVAIGLLTAVQLAMANWVAACYSSINNAALLVRWGVEVTYTVMPHSKSGRAFSKGASCSRPLDTRGPWAVTFDSKNGTATSYMEGVDSGYRRAILL